MKSLGLFQIMEQLDDPKQEPHRFKFYTLLTQLESTHTQFEQNAGKNYDEKLAFITEKINH